MKFNRIAMLLAFLFLSHSLALADEAGIQKWVDHINKQNADILMIGSSMQGEGIDFRTLSDEIGLTVMDVRSGGSMSPWQYSMMKFVIPKLEKKPKAVIIETRVNYLTTPQKRMSFGVYQKAVNEIAGEDREVLDKLAFEGEGQPTWERGFEKELPPPDSYYWDFKQSVQTSFLPEMIRLAKEQGYQLIIARHKSRVYAEDPSWEQPQHKQYGQDMAEYLHANGVVFLDYTYNPELTLEHYANGDHLSRDSGRAIWTSLMAKGLKAVFAGEHAPNQRPAKQ